MKMAYVRWVAPEPGYSYASLVVRSWVRLIWSSVGVAVVAVAAQLGTAQALGIVRWTDHYDSSGGDSWSALLTWVTFVYAASVLAGAAVGRKAVRRAGRTDGVFARITAALAGAVGAAAAISLVTLQAGNAVPPVNVHPELLVSVIAGAGVVAGLVLALFALFVPPIAGGAGAFVAWIWLAAIGSSVAGILSHQPYPSPRLALIDAAYLDRYGWWPGPYVMVIAAGLVGLAVALIARWAGAGRFMVAVSGLAGPAIVAGAYAIAGTAAADTGTFLASLYAAGAGLVVATLVALPARPDAREEVGPRDALGRAEADRYRPGNYLAETRPGEVAPGPLHSTPARGDAARSYDSELPRPYESEVTRAHEREAAREGAHRAEEYPGGRTYGGSGYLGRDYDYPTDEYPTAPAAEVAPAMGQPPQTYGDGSFDWLRTLGGNTPAQRGASN